jgi:hypothetical protein
VLYEIDLACGRLSIDTVREMLPLDKLLGFATRRNPKRGFLFVSKVLGKHIPCAPRRMREVYNILAEPLKTVPGPVLVMGMAETATGLGGGVADSLAELRRLIAGSDVIYQHTTRHALAAEALVRFDEAHSHAPDHIVYAPTPGLAPDYYNAETLVLVDDEITTGRTLTLLAEAMLEHLPKVRCVVFASIVNWLDEDRIREIRQRLSQRLDIVCILDGKFSFERNPEFHAELPGQVTAQREAEVRADAGRRGLRMVGGAAEAPEAPALDPAMPVHVIGTGEFGYQPFLLAEQLERQGFEVYYQSSTRSPILPGGAITHSLTFTDEHGEGVTNYLHNPPKDAQVLVAYEAEQCAANHDLPEQLNAVPVFLPVPERREIA